MSNRGGGQDKSIGSLTHGFLGPKGPKGGLGQMITSPLTLHLVGIVLKLIMSVDFNLKFVSLS